MSTKPSIVLVHGAFHTPAHFNPLFAELRKLGYIVTVPALPSTHQKPAIKSQEPDRQAIRDAIDLELELGNDVVVFAHSYGGVPASTALKDRAKSIREKQGLKGGVTAVVYSNAFLVNAGTNFTSLNPGNVARLGEGSVSISQVLTNRGD